MPYVNSQGISIYYEVEGAGPPLVLHGGFGGSLQSWRNNGYAGALNQDYRLILIDPRGCGKSDKPHDLKDYEMDLRVADVVAILDDLNITKTHIWGSSQGGEMGFGAAQHAPERLLSVMVGGMHPYKLDRQIYDSWGHAALKDGIENYVAMREAKWGLMAPEQKAQQLANDGAAMWASSIRMRDREGWADTLPTMTMPTLLYLGEFDPLVPGAQEAVKHIPNGTLVIVPGLNHVQTSRRSDMVLPIVTKFLKEVEAARAA